MNCIYTECSCWIASKHAGQDESNDPRCDMAIHPDPRFPILTRDQADVIRLYIELKRDQDRSGREPEVLVNRPQELRHGYAGFPDESQELE